MANKFILYLCYILFFVLTGCASNDDSDNNASVKNRQSSATTLEQRLNAAKLAEQNNMHENALVNYVQALELDSNNVHLFFKVGQLQSKLDNADLAIRAYNRALTIDKNHIPTLTEIGLFNLQGKDYQQAKTLLGRAIVLDQQRLSAKSSTFNVKSPPKTVAERQLQYEQIHSQKQRLSEQDYLPLDNKSPVKAYNAYGIIYDLESTHKLARKMFMLVLKIKGQSSLVLSNLGYSYYLTNDFILAETYFKQAIDFDGSFDRAKSNLGLIYVRKGQYNRAIQLLSQVMTKAEAYNDVGYFLMLEGRYKEAEYFLQQAIERSPSFFIKANVNLENVEMYLTEAP